MVVRPPGFPPDLGDYKVEISITGNPGTVTIAAAGTTIGPPLSTEGGWAKAWRNVNLGSFYRYDTHAKLLYWNGAAWISPGPLSHTTDTKELQED